jgi:glycine betaine/proline transport system ATP-binding protein
VPHLEARALTKVFGPDPRAVLPLLADGVGKDQILERTGHTVGLQDVDVTVEPGETFVVMGLSGSGKSTLVRCLNRLIEPTAGTLTLDDTDLLALGPRALRELRRRRMGMVFQRFALLPHQSVLENVGFGLRIQGMRRRERERRAGAWVERVGLHGYERALPRELSGGMQQRVGLARALATDPEVLLMDEAFSALDPLIRREMQDELLRLQAELGKTIVFITHDLDEALRLGDRVAILKDGLLIQVGTPAEIVMQPADAYVRAFVKDVDRSRVLKVRHVMRPLPVPSALAGSAPVREGLTVPNREPGSARLEANMALQDALGLLAGVAGALPVVDATGRTVGCVDARTALAALVRDQVGAP